MSVLYASLPSLDVLGFVSTLLYLNTKRVYLEKNNTVI
jgi:hypothetical protein